MEAAPSVRLGAIALVVVSIAGCGLLRQSSHAAESMVEDAARSHVTVQLPRDLPPVDIGKLSESRLEQLRSATVGIFGDSADSEIQAVCRARDLIEAENASTPEDALTSAFGLLGLELPPPQRLRELVETTKRVLAADGSADQTALAAVALACLGAG